MLYTLILKINAGLNTISLKYDFERQIFENDNFIYSHNLCEKSLENKYPKKYFSYFVSLEMSDAVLEPRRHVY